MPVFIKAIAEHRHATPLFRAKHSGVEKSHMVSGDISAPFHFGRYDEAIRTSMDRLMCYKSGVIKICGSIIRGKKAGL